MGRVTPTRAQRNIAWIEKRCRIPEGKFVGKPLKLTAKQKRWLVCIYDSPTRMFILSMGRKGAKTALAAFLLLLHLAGPEARANSQLVSAAQSRDQAGILFSLAAKVVRMSPDLAQYIVVRDSLKQLFCQELGTLYRALSADVATSFGLSPIFTVHDELGQVRGPRSDLYEALETASAAQEQPLSIVISTQAQTDSDLLSVLIDDALTGADPRMKVELYTAPLDLDPFSDEAIRAANPHFDDFMNQDEVRRQAADAKRMPSRESSFRNLVLNQRVDGKSPFVPRSIWLMNGAEPKPYQRGRVYAGLDLSAISDLTALVLLWKDDKSWQIDPHFWTPEQGIADRAHRDRVEYDLWVQQGHLMTTPGATVDYDFVALQLLQITSEYELQAIAFDRWRIELFKGALQRQGATEAFIAKLCPFGQGFSSMSPAVEALEAELLNARMSHGNHPVLTMCASNVTVMRDPAGNRKFTKVKSTGRIDGMQALAMAIGVAVSSEVAQPPAPKFQAFSIGR
jgi:phage terminase large subunit-like protein